MTCRLSCDPDQATVLLALAAFLAAVIPARRAAGNEPMEALCVQ